MTIRKRNGKWVVDFRHNGMRVRRTSPGSTRRDAEAFGRRIQTQLAASGSFEPEAADQEAPTFEEFWQTWFDEYVLVNNGHCEQISKQQAFRNTCDPHLGSND